MKKILTFLVMLFVTVSVAVAQGSETTNNGNGPETQLNDQVLPEAQPIYFNYQAVVRDITNANALYHDKDNLKVTIEIFDAQHAEAAVYTEVHENVKTNHNGMASLLIGKGQPTADADIMNVDWSTAYIASTFEVEGTVISLVQTPITAVPLALQSQGPMKLTTDQIVKYILSPEPTQTDAEDVDAILNAISANTHGLKDYLKTTFYNYLKNHKEEAKDLVLYYLNLVDPEDLDEAEEYLKPETKQKIIDMLVQYAKDNRDAAKEILTYYISTTDTNEIKQVYDSIPQTIKDWSVERVIAYIKAHPELAEQVAKAYYDGATATDVNKVYNYLHTNEAVYARLVEIFDNHLLNYLTAHHYLTGVCEGKEGSPFKFCDIVDRVVSLEHAINQNVPTPTPEPQDQCNNAKINDVTCVYSTNDHKYIVTITLDKELVDGENISINSTVDFTDPVQAGTAGTVYTSTYDSDDDDLQDTITVTVHITDTDCSDSKSVTYPGN